MVRGACRRWRLSLDVSAWAITLALLSACVPSAPPAPPRVVRSGEHPVVSYLAATYLRSLGHRGTGPIEFREPAGLSVDARGNLYVADSGNHRVQVIAPDGRLLGHYGSEGWRVGEFQNPADLFVRDVTLYVADTGNHRIQVCTLGDWMFRVAVGPETLPDLDSPQGVCADTQGRIYLTDTHHRWVCVQPLAGEILQSGEFGTDIEPFRFPTGIRTSGSSGFYVADTGNHRIRRFDFAGTHLLDWGRFGRGPGELERPTAIALDSEGRVFVADSLNHRVQVFDPSGRHLLTISHPDLVTPNGVAVSRDGHLYVSDLGADDIKIFLLLRGEPASDDGRFEPNSNRSSSELQGESTSDGGPP